MTLGPVSEWLSGPVGIVGSDWSPVPVLVQRDFADVLVYFEYID
jgi:hypothetical protein